MTKINYNTITQQEALEIAYNQYMKQGGPSRDIVGCLYRGPDGKKCAVGALINDEDYDTKFDVEGVGDTGFWYWYEEGEVPFVELGDTLGVQFLNKLQHLHDTEQLDYKPYVQESLEKYNLDFGFMDND